MKQLKILVISILTCSIVFASRSSFSSTLSVSKYIDSAYLTSIPFGTHSHWIQPWRAYMETVPAHKFLDGIGIVWNVSQSGEPELIAAMLAKHGFKRVRVEIGWGAIDYDDETQIIKAHSNRIQNVLLALKKYNLRPLILLNSHHGVPCPRKSIQLTLSKNANLGDTKIELDSIDGLRSGYSGISNISNQYWAAEYLITNIANNTVTLSKPLPKNLAAGTVLKIDTLKYRPFSEPSTTDYKNTIAGWNQYVDTVTEFVTESLGTGSGNDKGFDLEIWNELTFGSNFLYINKYYANELYQYRQNDIWKNLVQETADYVEANSAKFKGVEISNGFANTIPWPASSEQPDRISAIGKHPYPPIKNYPQDERKTKGLNALAKKDSFVPTYSVWFPEYIATALQTETIIRDAAPITNEFYGTKRGRYARVINGKVAPVPIWMTEINIRPAGGDPNISKQRALDLKAKSAARFFCFYLNKGITQLYLYGVAGKDEGWGIVQDNFLQYAQKTGSIYPKNDADYVSPALKVVSRIVDKMTDGLDEELRETQALKIVSIEDEHNRYQFKGDGSKGRPNLYNRDVFTFLPYQVNSNKFVIPYYVMTRDIRQDLPPEEFTVQIEGVNNIKSIEVYDPISDRTILSQKLEKISNSITLELTATDYPYLLILD